MNKLRFGWMVALCGLLALGCGDDKDDDARSAQLEIVGEYDDNFMGEQIITAGEWNGAAIVDYDNAKNLVYTQLPDDDEFNPSKFTKTVYTELKSGSFYFCMVEYSLDTLEDAQASEKTADEGDLDGEGCSGFSWTKATKKE